MRLELLGSSFSDNSSRLQGPDLHRGADPDSRTMSTHGDSDTYRDAGRSLEQAPALRVSKL
jgi:hypothetical protein